MSLSSPRLDDHRQQNNISDKADPTVLLGLIASLSTATFPNLTAATDLYLKLVMETLGMRSAFLAHLDSDVMTVLNAFDNDGCHIPTDGIVPIEQTFCQYVRAGGVPVIVPNAADDPRVTHIGTRTEFNIGSYLGVPLILSDGTLYGTLCVLDPDPREFEAAHVQFLQIIARQITLFIERDFFVRAENDAEHALGATLYELDERVTLLRVVAHDIRSPLSNILGCTDAFEEGLFGPVSLTQQKMLAHIGQSAQFINRLATDLLDASAAESRTLTLLGKKFDPYDLAQSVIETAQMRAAERDLKLSLQVEAPLPAMVGDIDRIKQILLNLVNNAIRYTAMGSITVRVSELADKVRFSVEDTGPGISPESQQVIWNLHLRAHANERGLGLGLYIVQRLATAMGGTVGMQSVPTEGSTFWVDLPIQGPAPQKIQWR